ncbi:MAG: tripartite tricarboxylate transporter TctB family protein [Spirochaetales bacterium]|nr:tripartite tricarboxylate transporter TctB family protein [Spirochaetales bacterium]
MKKKLPWGELVFLLAILGYVLYYFLSVKGYGTRAVMWPYVLMVGTVLAVVAVAVEVIKNAPSKEGGEATDVEATDKKSALKTFLKNSASTLVIIVSFVIYTLLLKKLGIHLCNFLLSFFLVLYISKGKWLTALIAAAVLTLSFYLVFGLALGLRLPKFKLF